MIIMKFGGSSLADAERIRHVGSIVNRHLEENPILVLSAMGKTTDDLIAAGQAALAGEADHTKIAERHLAIVSELNLSNKSVAGLLDELLSLLKGIAVVRELTARTKDYLLSFGERLSVRLFSDYLCQQGMRAEAIDGWDAGLVTSSDYNRAEPLSETHENIAKRFQHFDRGVPVVTGFIAKDLNGEITTLGRGGSDLTAALLGAALNVREIQVWKDVHGILSTDPRILETAFPVPSLSFEEAAEMAYFGAKVLHPTSILPAMKKGIPVRVKNSYDPSHPGTLIRSDGGQNNGWVTSITCKPGQALIHICSTRMLGQYGFLAKVFQVFADLKLSVDVIATSEFSLSLTLENQERLAELEKRLGEIATIRIQQGKAIISLIGSSIHSAQILEKSLKTLSQGGIEVEMVSHGASRVNTSLVVSDGEAKRGICLLHAHFFEGRREE